MKRNPNPIPTAQRKQRTSDFGLLTKVLTLNIDQDSRNAFENMHHLLTTELIVLTTKQRAWAHRLVKRLCPKKPKAPTGDRSPVVSKEANRAMRKIDRWLEQQRGESVPVPTHGRSISRGTHLGQTQTPKRYQAQAAARKAT